MRVEIGQCPCCKEDLELEIEFSVGDGADHLTTRLQRARLIVPAVQKGERSSLAEKVLGNAKTRHPNANSHIDRQDGQD